MAEYHLLVEKEIAEIGPVMQPILERHRAEQARVAAEFRAKLEIRRNATRHRLGKHGKIEERGGRPNSAVKRCLIRVAAMKSVNDGKRVRQMSPQMPLSL